MTSIHLHEQLEDCRRLWEAHFRGRSFFEQWPVRRAFQEGFARQPLFISATAGGRSVGLLPLAWMAEEERFGYFPGETWGGRTWFEQNRLFAESPEIAAALLAAIPGPSDLRYLRPENLENRPDLVVDEINYSLQPAAFGFQLENHLENFSGRSRKKILREVEGLKELEPEIRLDQSGALEDLFALNLAAYGERSYFHDPRFLESFRQTGAWLAASGRQRLVSVFIKGRLAAVDLVAVEGRDWTILAGGTSPEFPGIAKFINLFHLEEACRLQIENLDFLCGDFNWKERFRLTARTLFQLAPRTAAAGNG